MKKTIAWTIGCLTVLMLILGMREWSLLPDGKVHVVFFDIGQGDSALITLGDGTRILMDGGRDWAPLEKLGNWMPFFDRRIDVITLSHPHADHLASFPEVLRRYSVGTLITAGSEYGSAQYAATLSGAKIHGIPVAAMHAGQSIRFGKDSLDVLWPPAKKLAGMGSDVNNESLIVRFSHGDKRILFTGDSEKLTEDVLVAAKADLRADILKVGHHGSRTSSSTGFLLAVQPMLSIVSVGKDNEYKHPSPEIVRRLQEFGGTMRRTDIEGDIEVVWP